MKTKFLCFSVQHVNGSLNCNQRHICFKINEHNNLEWVYRDAMQQRVSQGSQQEVDDTLKLSKWGGLIKGLYGSWALIFDLSNMVNSYPSAFRATRPSKPTNSNIKTSKGEKSHLSTQGSNARLNIEWWH